jgi:hypothetical protein
MARPSLRATTIFFAGLATMSWIGERSALAGPCPTVMLILDRSGSMDNDPSGGLGTPSKLDIAKTTLTKLVTQYGAHIPFGFTTFQADGLDCSMGVDVQVKPMDGTKALIISDVMAVMSGGSTNTGPAIDAVAALPEMKDKNRPGSYIILITDGEPNCPGHVGTETTDPEYTVGAITRAAAAGIKTFVVGFGALPAADKMAMNMMAMAGQEPCTGTGCAGQMFYAAENDMGLQTAIAAISQTIVGEFGGTCDDSCYAMGCPNAGEICVNGKCQGDPCAAVSATCAPGDYCYTNGTSAGTCTGVCPITCPTGQSCTLSGCAVDPCNGVVCDSSSSCVNGTCVKSTCMDCDQAQFCSGSTCMDDPCHYVKCPDGSTCTPQKGTCIATTNDGTGSKHARSGGCHFTPGASAPPALLAFLLLALLGSLWVRARRG